MVIGVYIRLIYSASETIAEGRARDIEKAYSFANR